MHAYFGCTRAANQIGVVVSMHQCPGVQSVRRQCLFAAWGYNSFLPVVMRGA